MRIDEKNIIKIIAFSPLFIIPLIVVAVVWFVIKTHNDNFDHTLNKLTNDLKQSQKLTIKTKIDNISDLTVYQNSLTLNNLTKKVKDRVDSALKIADSIYDKYKDTKTEKEIKEIIISTLRPLVWNDGESFIWIIDFNGIFQLAPSYLKHKEGTSVLNIRDATGRYVIQEEIEICKTKGEGFLWDTFTKPNDPTKKQHEQVAFVKTFGKYNWYFGSGEYLERARKVSDKNLLNSISKVGTASDYIFVLDKKGKILLNPALPDVVGRNILEVENENTRKVFSNLLKKSQVINSSFLSYEWFNPLASKYEKKYSYVKKIPNKDWVIGSGFYDSTIQKLAKDQTTKLYDAYQLKVNNILTIGIIILLITFVLSVVLSKYIKSSFIRYQTKINAKAQELLELNQTLEEKVQERTKELEKSKESLEILATTDSLTKTHNRYSIMNILQMEINRAKRYNQPLCVLMYDIDHFKLVNDTYGHDCGDHVLLELTNIVKDTLREIDYVGRYGGEEFIAVLPNTDLQNAKAVTERLRIKVQNTKFKQVEQITISLGLVQFKNDESIDNLFKRLDNLLYRSKENGRNQLNC